MSNRRMERRPTQAVILAGGLGERLRPFTETSPKPMIPIHGKPFLEYLIELLKTQGFHRILLLLGYLPRVIQDYFGNGSGWNIQIDYAVTSPSEETGRRLFLARDRIDPVFLLTYADNYWPLKIDKMWQNFAASGASAQITVYRNDDGYTRSNVRMDKTGRVTCYDKSREQQNLAGVDIGFMIAKREILDEMPEGNVSFEREVYPKLIAKGRLQGYLTGHRYYSIGTHERLGVTEAFLARRPAVILDRDGVLNQKPPRAEYVRSWADWRWLPGAREALRLLREMGYRVILISNQAGIARGVMTVEDLHKIHKQMCDEIQRTGGCLDAIYHCPHGWDEGCVCRKPQPGMLFQAQRDFHLDLSRTTFIGDDARDVEAGEAAGCPTFLVTEENPLVKIVEDQFGMVYQK